MRRPPKKCTYCGIASLPPDCTQGVCEGCEGSEGGGWGTRGASVAARSMPTSLFGRQPLTASQVTFRFPNDKKSVKVFNINSQYKRNAHRAGGQFALKLLRAVRRTHDETLTTGDAVDNRSMFQTEH